MASENTTLTGDGIPIRIGRLATIEDSKGSIRVGWVHDSGMYVQLKGGPGAWVCSEYTQRLALELKSRLETLVFIDSTGLARSLPALCFVNLARTFFRERARIGGVTVLVKSALTAKLLTSVAALLRVPLRATKLRRVFWIAVLRPHRADASAVSPVSSGVESKPTEQSAARSGD
jgi:hypothetical protein